MLECGIAARTIRDFFPTRYSLPGDVSASNRYWVEDVIEPEVEVTPQGTIRIPDAPGLGYHVRRELIERWTLEKKPGARGSRLTAIGRKVCFIVLLVAALAAPTYAQSDSAIMPGPKPPDAPRKWKELVGIYSATKTRSYRSSCSNKAASCFGATRKV